MKRILITGVTGFVGTNLVKHLLADNKLKVIGYSRDPDKARSILHNIDFIQKLTPVLLDRYLVDTVVHLAGIAHDISGDYSKEDYLNSNYTMTCELFDAVQKSGVKNFIFISSVKALTDHSDVIVDENYIPDPKSDYGISKQLAEEYILGNSSQYKKTYILRPCMIHGPGNKGNLNVLYKFVKSGLPYPLAAFTNKRSYLSIDNFCFVIDNIMSGNMQPGDFLLADSQSISTKELVQMMAEVKGRKLRQLTFPKRFVVFIAKVGNAIKAPFNTTSLAKLVGNMEISNKKLVAGLGTELPMSVREGLMKTINSFDD